MAVTFESAARTCVIQHSIRCIVIWETGADGVPELEFVAPLATVPAYEEARARNSENWPRMLTPLRPCSPLGIDDLQDWAHEEDCEIGLN